MIDSMDLAGKLPIDFTSLFNQLLLFYMSKIWIVSA